MIHVWSYQNISSSHKINDHFWKMFDQDRYSKPEDRGANSNTWLPPGDTIFILLMEEILNQLIGSSSHHLQGFLPSTVWFLHHVQIQNKKLHQRLGLMRHIEKANTILYWLVVSTHLKNIRQNGNFPQVGVKIKNIWNHHLDHLE